MTFGSLKKKVKILLMVLVVIIISVALKLILSNGKCSERIRLFQQKYHTEKCLTSVVGALERHIRPGANITKKATSEDVGRLPLGKIVDWSAIAQDDPRLVKWIQAGWLEKPSSLPYRLNEPERSDFSLGQSPLVDRVLKRKRNGFFVECGAMDGEGRSNTLFFEKRRNWTGLLVEGNVLNYKMLKQKHRKAYSINACASIVSHPKTVKFNLDTNMGRVIEGEKDLKWVKAHKRRLKLASVQCFPLYSMLVAMNRTSVDYFSLDVEGSEMDILKTIPFDKLHIGVMSVEILHGEGGKRNISNFLLSKGFSLIPYKKGEKIVHWDLLFEKNHAPVQS